MARKVAVNGLGRIGRLVLRELLEDDRFQVLPWCPARRAPPWGSRRLPPLSTSAFPYSMAYRRRYTRSPLPRWYLTMPRGVDLRWNAD